MTAVPRMNEGQVGRQLRLLRQYVENRSGLEPKTVQQTMQKAMWDEMVVFKDGRSLSRLLETLDGVKKDLLPVVGVNTPTQLRLAAVLPTQLTISEIIARVAQAREESRGPHYRVDYPQPDDARFGKPMVVTRVDDDIQLYTRP